MSQSLAKILVHGVFSTKDRRPFLRDPIIRAELHAYLGGILHHLDCPPLQVGGVADHVHVLFVMSRTVKPSDVIKEIKRSSTLWLKERCPEMWGFAWQRGYGLFSIGFSQMRTVCAYIARQEEHHRRRTFQEEFRQLLQRYAIDYDERYVWD